MTSASSLPTPAEAVRQHLPRGVPRLLQETATGRLSVREVFPPRRALARGKGAVTIGAVALLSFGLLFSLVKRNGSQATDLRATRSLQRVKNPAFDRLMRAVSWPGFPPQSRIIPPALAAGWLVMGFPMEAAFQFAAWGAAGISHIVKRVMKRPRPVQGQVMVRPARIGGSSFPSGHVLIYTGVYGFLALLLETLIRSSRIRRVAVGALTGLVALVGPSRIYLGHHWLTDVLASYLLGTTYVLALMATYRRAKTRWLNRERARRQAS